MGSVGAGNAIHLHLTAQARGDVLKAAGGSGRSFRSNNKSLSNRPLTAAAIQAAAPQAFYYINPEPFLVNQLPYRSSVFKYAEVGGRKQTLPRTCSPSQTPVPTPADGSPSPVKPSDSPKIVASTTETGDAKGVVESIASDRASEPGGAAMAGQSRHGVMTDLARVIAAEQMANSASADFENQARLEIALAHLLVLKAERIGRVNKK